MEIALVEALRYVVDWLLFPVIFYEIARRRGWLDRYPRYIGALNWINLPAMVVAAGRAWPIASVAPAAVAVILDLGLQALFFYWFLMTTRMTLGAELADLGRAAGRELGAVALPVIPRRLATSASSPSAGALGRSAPPSGRGPCGGAVGPARVRSRAASASSTSRLAPLAAADELQRADQDAHLVVQERTGADIDAGSPRRCASPSSRSSVLIDDGAWQAVERKLLKSWWPTQHRGGLGHGLGIERHRHVPDVAAVERRRRAAVQDAGSDSAATSPRSAHGSRPARSPPR